MQPTSQEVFETLFGGYFYQTWYDEYEDDFRAVLADFTETTDLTSIRSALEWANQNSDELQALAGRHGIEFERIGTTQAEFLACLADLIPAK